MNKSLLCAFVSIATVVTISSCVDKNYKVLGVDTISNEMTLVGPIGHTNIKLFEALPDSFHSFKFGYDENDVYFTKQDTQHLGNDIKGSIKMTPTHDPYEMWAGFKVDASDKKKATADEVFEFDFFGINTDPNERLDSIMYKDGEVMTIYFASDVNISYGELVFSFDEDVISLNPYIYPDNKAVFTKEVTGKEAPLKIDMGRAVAKFNGGKKLSLNLHAEIRSTEDIEDYQSITFAIYFGVMSYPQPYKAVKPIEARITYGYLGPDRHLSETTKTIDFAYTKDLQSGSDFFLPFYDPQIRITGINSIGIPAWYNLHYVKVYNTETLEEQYADFNGSPSTSFELNYPSTDVLKGKNRAQINAIQMKDIQKYTTFLCDRSYGHTDRLFKIRANKLEYSYEIRTQKEIGTDFSFFFDNSNIDIVMDVKLPCRFEGNASDWMKNFYIDRFDTVKIDFTGIKPSEQFDCTDETVARLKLDFINHLPVDGDATYWFVDKNNKMILPQKKSSVTVKAAPSDASGVVTAPAAETNTYIKFNYSEFKELTEKGAGMILKYKIINKDLKDIWFKSNDWIDLTIEAWAQGTVSYKFTKEGGEQ